MTLRLGIIGMSDGNGHPYSWSAILNGYDREAMGTCPFPAIPAYLAEHDLAIEGLGHLGRVTHVYAQSESIAKDIARSSRIPNVVAKPEDMLPHVDAVLLARDDAQNHLSFATPCLQAGKPIFIDKPCATRVADLEKLLSLERWPGQLFTCAAVRYARELSIESAIAGVGRLTRIEGTAPKRWETYAVHFIEPIVAALRTRLPISRIQSTVTNVGGRRSVEIVLDDGVQLGLQTTGDAPSPVGVRVIGTDGECELTVRDAFTAFRRALEVFLTAISDRTMPIPRVETRTVVRIIEVGLVGGRA